LLISSTVLLSIAVCVLCTFSDTLDVAAALTPFVVIAAFGLAAIRAFIVGFVMGFPGVGSVVDVVDFEFDDIVVDGFVGAAVDAIVEDVVGVVGVVLGDVFGVVVGVVVGVEVVCFVVVVVSVVVFTFLDVELNNGHTLTQKSISVSECSSFPHSFKQLSTSLDHPSPQQTARFLSVFLVFPGQLSGHFARSQASQLLNSHKFIVSIVASKTQGFREIPH